MKSYAKSPRRSGDSRPSYPRKRNDRAPSGERVRDERSEGFDNLIAGRNAVMETLKNGSRVDTVYIARGATGGSIAKIIAMAKDGGYPVKEISPEKLDEMSPDVPHQGVAVSLSAVEYAEVEDILQRAAEAGHSPFIIIADEVEDPHNLGALIRTAETAGADGVIIPKRRNVGLTPAVFKTSAGAAAHLPVARVANLASTVDELKQQGVWVYGADMDGQNWCQTDFSGGVALIVGSEGKGISRLLREKCDVMVSLPMQGEITSLNASVAGGIIMYEVARQRLGIAAVQPKK